MADDKLVVTFFNHAVPNKRESEKQGRPIFKDMECCRIVTPGDRQSEKVFPAHERSRWTVDADGNQVEQTYAERYNEQYLRFKNGQQQVADGTPLSELPFLTEAKRRELRALHIFTAEALAALDGQPLKNLGMGGRELKNQAQAYIDAASGSANVTALASRIAELEAMLASQNVQVEPATVPDTAPSTAFQAGSEAFFAQQSDEELKQFIADRTGSKPRGNPNHDTLVRMASEIVTTEAA